MTSDNPTPNEPDTPDIGQASAEPILDEVIDSVTDDDHTAAQGSNPTASDNPDSDPIASATITANKKVKTPRNTSAVGWLALLLALAALAGTAYNFWQQQQVEQSALNNIASVENATASLQSELQADLQNKLNAVSSDSENLLGQLNQSNARLERKLRVDFDELGARLSETEQQIVNLKGFSDEAKHTYVKAEIEYFLQTANNRILLAQDAGTAQAALEAADERLNILRDPGLTHVRAQVRDEIQALKAVKQPDIEKIALTLASLSRQVPKLPLRMDDDEDDYFNEEIQLKEGTGFKVAMSNVWRNMRGTLDKLVEVRDATPSDVPLLSVEDVRLVYANLDIQLQSARLAALKGDAANYQVSLEGAGQLLSVYFDAQQQPVQAVIETLNEIKSLELAPRLPDISKSLKMLRSLRSADNSSLTTSEVK